MTSALNVSKTEEVLPLYSKNQSIREVNHHKSKSKQSQKSSQVKSNEELIKTLAWTIL